MTFEKPKEEKRIPVEERPLRHAGQSLEEELEKQFSEKVMYYMMLAFFLLFLLGMEWIRYLTNSVPHPVVATVIYLPVVGYLGWKFVKLIPQLKALSLGIKGEKAMAERMVELQAAGCRVLHDIPGKAGNIDHVVIGPAGVFAIETKTLRKRRSPNAKVRHDGQCITVDGMTPQRDPLTQALAEAAEIRAILQKSTGKTFFVQPVIVYPGWYVEQLVPNPKVWVFNDKYLVKYLKDQPRKLEDSDVNLAAFHLEQYVRSRKE